MVVFFFFFKQKTAYEMRISDWSSDVCSSDLLDLAGMARYVFLLRCAHPRSLPQTPCQTVQNSTAHPYWDGRAGGFDERRSEAGADRIGQRESTGRCKVAQRCLPVGFAGRCRRSGGARRRWLSPPYPARNARLGFRDRKSVV